MQLMRKRERKSWAEAVNIWLSKLSTASVEPGFWQPTCSVDSQGYNRTEEQGASHEKTLSGEAANEKIIKGVGMTPHSLCHIPCYMAG